MTLRYVGTTKGVSLVFRAACVLVLSAAAASAAMWHYLSGGKLSGISSVGSHVWTVGQDGLFFYSEDNGATWRRVPRFTTRNLVDVEFWDQSLGLATAEGDVVYRTTNNGARWDSASVVSGGSRVRFLTRDQLTITGRGALLWSTDAGQNWEDRNWTKQAVWFVDTLRGWSGQSGRWVYCSLDGGRNWSASGQVSDPYCMTIRAFGFADSSRGVCNYYAYTGNPRMFPWFGWSMTRDGGATWTHAGGSGAAVCCDVCPRDLIYGLEQRGCLVFDRDTSSFSALQPPTTLTDVFAARGQRVWVCGLGGMVWSSADSGERWDISRCGTTGAVSAMHFADSLRGWAAGPQSVIRTSDGGTSWVADTSLGEAIGRGYAGFSALDRSLAFATEDDIRRYWDQGTFYEGTFRIHRTTDGGTHWNEVLSEFGYPSVDWGATKIFFLDSLYGWHLGNLAANSVRTTDGGESWISMPGVAFPVRGLAFATADSGWATDQTGRIWHTTNSGDSWSVQYPGTIAWNLCVSSSQQVWAACDDGLLHTTDGGASWVHTAVASGVRAVHFSGERHGAAAGVGGLVLRTSDGGVTWTRDSCEFTSTLNAVFMLDSAHAWAAGDNGLVLGFGDWAVGAEEWQSPQLGRPAQFRVEPSVGRTRLTAYLDGRPAVVQVHDLTGRLVRSIAVRTGERELALDVRGLPAGVYYVSSVTASGRKSCRVVKVR